MLALIIATTNTTSDVELCHISHYEYVNVTREFSTAARFIGTREGVATLAARVIAVEIEKPHREFVVARCVFDSMLAVEIVDTLYREYPRRRYQSCVNEPLDHFEDDRISVAPIVKIVCMKVKEEQRAVEWVLACYVLLIVLLIAACVR
jgi:hypothetical protein